MLIKIYIYILFFSWELFLIRFWFAVQHLLVYWCQFQWKLRVAHGRERYRFYELESCLLLTQDRTLDFLSYVIYIIALSRRFSIFGYMISQPVGCFLINRLKEDIAARLDLIKSNSCLSGWCIRGQDALRHVTFQGG